ncbi:MAG: shikimate dehydrogenase [Acidobacteria bacterium]|nr:shikimate dehydrogenase [Acidobacteriota bacterium]
MISLSSLPRICVALGVADVLHLERLAVAACDDGEDFLELRLDMLHEPEAGIKVIRRVARRYPDAVLLATCRRKQNGGEFGGSIERQIEVLDQAVSAGAAMVDIEIETAETAPSLLAIFAGRSRLIVSYHNFETTPALSRAMRRLQRVPADIYKIAVFARKPSDGLRVLNLPSEYADLKIVSLAMGELAVPSRILGASRASAFVFASYMPRNGEPGSVPAAKPTAPGQISAAQLRNLYLAHRRQRSTKIFGVVADPVGHSLSPVLHNRAFKSRRIDAVYVPFLVRPNEFSDFCKVAEALPVEGFSVTIPHKQRVLRHLDSVDPLARRIGAVNTVFRRKKKLCGTNTDVLGIVAPLEKRMRLAKASVLIVGNGGAARGAIFALQDKGARVTLTGRVAARVRKLARECGVDSVDRTRLEGKHFDILINATPLGMSPNVDDCFFEDHIPAELVFDMVYNPLETRLLQMAKVSGKKTISGLEMFLEQAAAQFELWTGENAPRGVMKNAVLAVLAPPHAA